jgi:CheY-specific phosphatase CheX
METETMMKMMKEAISNVLGTMFFQLVDMKSNNCKLQEWFPDTQSLVGATLHFYGSSKGTFYLLVPASMTAEITANFLGIKEEEVNEKQEKDAIKEALNMIAGNTLSFFDKEGDLTLGIPELIPSNDLTGNYLESLKGNVIFIETDENRLAAGVEFEI